MVKTLNDYLEKSYKMEIIEDKEEGGFIRRIFRTVQTTIATQSS